MRKFRQRKAFTIVEMSIVIAVIAILSAVMIPSVSGIVQNTRISADKQFVASLNTQLAVWEVDNGKIGDDLHKLDKAIAEFYGSDFVLEAKSARYGYGFHYSPDTGRVYLLKVGEEGNVDLGGISGNNVPTQDDSGIKLTAVTLGGAATSDIFSFHREYIINGKTFLYLKQIGSELDDILGKIENVENNTQYGTYLSELDALANELGDNSVARLIHDNLLNVAIANENGVFFHNETTEIKEVYVAYGTKTVGASKVDLESVVTSVTTMHFPETYKTINSDSYTGLTTDDTKIYYDQDYDKSDIEKNIGTDAFNGTLVLSNGEVWADTAETDDKLINVKTEEEAKTEDKYSSKLATFTLSAESDTSFLHFYGENEDKTNPELTNTLHITGDATNVTINASNFIDENGKAVSRKITCDEGTTSADGTSVIIDVTSIEDGEVITVSAGEKDYSFKVERIGIKSFTASLDQTQGSASQGENGAVYTATLKYASDSSWDISSNVVLYEDCIPMSNAVDVSLVDYDSTKISLSDDKKSLNIGPNATGTFTASLVLTTVAKNANGKQMTITFNLTFQPAETVFALADNADVFEKYGINLTVGSASTIKLGTLFALKAGNTVDASKIAVRQFTSEEEAKTFVNAGSDIITDKTNANWTEWTIQPTTSSNLKTAYIAIYDGSSSCVLAVKVAQNAYNVADYSEWLAVPNSKSIVVVKDFTFDAYQNKGAHVTGETYPAKNVGAGIIYGNYNKITIDTFTIAGSSSGSNNYFIQVSSGGLNNVVIEGPEYKTVSTTWKDTSGYYVAGVQIAGNAKINDSYISGFRSPVRVNDYSPVITRTVLCGGVYASIYVRDAVKITLDDVTIVQYKNSQGKMGAGMYFDTLAGKNGTADSVILYMKGDTSFNVWMKNSEDYGGEIEKIKDALVGQSGCGDEATFSAYVHDFDDDKWVNACIGVENDGGNAWDQFVIQYDANDFEGTTFANKAEVTGKSGYYCYSSNCAGASCDHTVISSYTADDFIASKKK